MLCNCKSQRNHMNVVSLKQFVEIIVIIIIVVAVIVVVDIVVVVADRIYSE